MTTVTHVRVPYRPTRRALAPSPWSARRAFELDLSWVQQHLAALRDAAVAGELRGIRTHAGALRSVLTQHMVWERDLTEEQGGPGWEDLASSIRRWHGTIHRSLFSIGMLVGSSSLEHPAVREMLRRSVDGLDALLECYAEEAGASVYRALDRRPPATDARAASFRRHWREIMAAGYVW